MSEAREPQGKARGVPRLRKPDLSPWAYGWGTCLLAILNEAGEVIVEMRSDRNANAVRLLRRVALDYLDGRLRPAPFLEAMDDDPPELKALQHGDSALIVPGKEVTGETWLELEALKEVLSGGPMEPFLLVVSSSEGSWLMREAMPGRTPEAEVIVRAVEELLDVLTTPRLTLRRCPAPAPRGGGDPCGRWFVDLPRGRPREYCSGTCQRRAARWIREGLERRKLGNDAEE